MAKCKIIRNKIITASDKPVVVFTNHISSITPVSDTKDKIDIVAVMTNGDEIFLEEATERDLDERLTRIANEICY